MGRVSTEASTMNKHHDLSDLKFENGFLSINIDGEIKKFQLKKKTKKILKISLNLKKP